MLQVSIELLESAKEQPEQSPSLELLRENSPSGENSASPAVVNIPSPIEGKTDSPTGMNSGSATGVNVNRGTKENEDKPSTPVPRKGLVLAAAMDM